MAATVILIPDDPSLDLLFFDATRNEQHLFETELTDSPVESGAKVTDHAIHQPDTFTCTVLTTNTPALPTWDGSGVAMPLALQLPGYPAQQTAEGTRPPTPSRVAQARTYSFNGTDRVREALDRLDELRLGVKTLSVITSKREYSSMVIVSIDLPIDKSSHLGAFTVKFRKLEVVTTDQVNAPQPKEPRGAPATSAGTTDPIKTALDHGAELVKKYVNFDRSVLVDIFGGAG